MAAIERHWDRLTPVSLLLLPVSLLFCALVWLRRQLYRHGLLRSTRLLVPVIVVGNITVGGTGKTPLVIWLAALLKQAGYRPGIVTRGYRGAATAWPVAVTAATPAAEAGDEAVLLARRGGAPVMAGPDRVSAARRLVEAGCSVIISDDGLQHYRLQRDLEIAVIDGERRFGNGLCLPAGPLREPPSRLRTVTLRVTQGTARPGETGMRLVPEYFYRLDHPAERVAPGYFAHQPAHAVAGIGHPERFFNSLRALGVPVVPHPYPDHHAFVAADLDFGDDRPVLMTEKDAVKCTAFARPHHWVLAVTADPDPLLADDILNRLEELARG